MLAYTLSPASQMGRGSPQDFSLVKSCIYTAPNNQAESEEIQSLSQMVPDAWHCVDRNSQMAGWIFHFPSGCVTWWRCSQSLEPKENASQGDEALLLSRHLLLAGRYCDLGLTYSFRIRLLLQEQQLLTSRNKEGGRKTQIDLERMSNLLCLPGHVCY